MVDAKRLLADLQKLTRKLEDDLRRRCADNRDVDDRVRGEYNKAKGAGRTSQAYEAWRDEFITQAAVAWILGCVFVRFLEDNQLIEPPRLAGPGERLNVARDQHTLYFRRHPADSDREYLEYVFREVEKLPAMKALFDERHNPLWTLGLTGDGATMLLSFWQQVDPASGALVYDFADAEWKTRFLGDLYQDLSEAARKKYALLQTPIFVEEFILDRTLQPAIDEFGYETIRMIDPACGSGHFLLGAFRRLFDLWVRNEPGSNPRVLAQKALDSIFGVDLNPYAVAIARFRLLLAALKASDVTRLKDAPDFKINTAAGDSLLHGEHAEQMRMGWHPIAHVYETEDRDELNRVLKRGHYHAVVGNPPYITVKDAALNKAYRERFGSCHRQYSLAVPFMERFFDLAILGNGDGRTLAGYVGMITANSFMKREFGKKLIEQYIPRWDLTHVIDTAKAHIPGHGTPTVIIFGRNRQPVASTIRAVMGIKSEAVTPNNPAHGLVWSTIVGQVDHPGSQSEFVSVADTSRNSFHKHPWSIGGGGAAELKELLDEQAKTTLSTLLGEIGRTTHTGEDEVFYLPQSSLRTNSLVENCVPLVMGEDIRDFMLIPSLFSIFPYEKTTAEPLREMPKVLERHFWIYRAPLRDRQDFGQKIEERGLRWFDHSMFFPNRYRIPLSVAFAFVSTHNHFTLDHGGKVFKQSAPVIKLANSTNEREHLELLGLLNNSTACFWMKQVFHNKGGGGIGGGLATEFWEQFFEFDGTKLRAFPIAQEKPLELARRLDDLAQELQATLPAALAERATPSQAEWQRAEQRAARIRSEMIALQEELDWQCYKLYGLIADDMIMPIEEITLECGDLSPLLVTTTASAKSKAATSRRTPNIKLGERAFEIVMARRMAAGELETTWFERHGSTPITDIPEHWSKDYRELVERRIALIESDRNIALIEQPEYKRRWNSEPWAAQQERALREWLLYRLEDARYWTELQLTSCARLADRMRQDAEFMQVAEFYRGRRDFDLANLITELVRSEAVPFLPVLRYKESGLRNRALWERTWELQRQEDAIDARTRLPEGDPQRLTVEQAAQLKRERIGDIAVPPKYKSSDFQDTVYWRLRGKLDVPKERFISYPYCQRAADPTPVIAWAGWDHLQQAQAQAAYYEMVRTNEGWSEERRVPLLAGLLELVPWLLQWHNEIDPAYGVRMGDYFKSFVEEEARGMDKTIDEIRGWRPQATASRR
jgi:uncharacterized protein DUF7008/Eco57I restriction-modification methylase